MHMLEFERLIEWSAFFCDLHYSDVLNTLEMNPFAFFFSFRL